MTQTNASASIIAINTDNVFKYLVDFDEVSIYASGRSVLRMWRDEPLTHRKVVFVGRITNSIVGDMNTYKVCQCVAKVLADLDLDRLVNDIDGHSIQRQFADDLDAELSVLADASASA